MPPKLLVNVFFVQLISVVTFFECLSRPAKSPGISASVQKWRVICRSPGNVRKISRNFGNLIDLYLQVPGKNSCHYPPPHPPNRVRLRKLRKFLLLPPALPANLVRLWKSRNISATTPSPTESGRLLEITENLPGGPPKQKSWLRRWTHNMFQCCF